MWSLVYRLKLSGVSTARFLDTVSYPVTCAAFHVRVYCIHMDVQSAPVVLGPKP